MSSQEMIYTIRIKGLLDPQWSDCLSGFQITTSDRDPSITLLAGPVPDQAFLRGVLNKLWDLNLVLLSITCVEESSETKSLQISFVPVDDAEGHHPKEVNNGF
jgi:hypothetical protein